MLALILSCALGLTGLRAQSNTEYNFVAYPLHGTIPSYGMPGVPDGLSFDGQNVDPMPILTMDCLAANGYGQWTMSTQAGVGSFGGLNGADEYPHWRNGKPGTGTHFYLRDWNRTFDEPIDENTLVTDICRVTDGSGTGTNHGGTFGATITKNYRMTVWSDPNYAYTASDVTKGIYQANTRECTGGIYIGDGTNTLNNLRLTVGDGTSESAATFTMAPNSMFIVDNLSTGQGLTVSGNSLFDYYGLSNVVDNTGAVTSIQPVFSRSPLDEVGELTDDGGGDIFLNGTASLAANMNVHGGADFHLSELSSFESTYGNIDIKNEPNIFPINANGSTNSDASGIMTFEGKATFSYSRVTGHLGEPGVNPRSACAIIHVCGSGESAWTYSLQSDHTTYSDLYTDPNTGLQDPWSLAVILCDQGPDEMGVMATHPYQDVSSDHDAFNNVEITAVDPQNTDADQFATNFSVTDGTFYVTPYKGVDLEKMDNTDYPEYGNIVISGNTFNPLQPQGWGSFVYASGFNTETLTDAHLGQIAITYNNIYPTAGEGWQYGINFFETDGFIGHNTISSSAGYSGVAINITGYHSGGHYDGTFLCGNTISGSGIWYGIETSEYQGYLELNDISGVQFGWWHSVAGGPPHLLATKIYNCLANGIKVDATVDLSGLHHYGEVSGNGDLGGFNQIHDNAGEQIKITTVSTPSNDVSVWAFQDIYGSTWSTSYAGLNDIYQGLGASTALIQGDAYSNATIDIGNNYWGGPDPTTPSSTYWPDFVYSASVAAVAKQSIPNNFICVDGLGIARRIGESPLSVPDTDSCLHAIATAHVWEEQLYNYGPAYDTMKWYISHCYENPNGGTWSVFGGSFDSVVKTAAGRKDVFNFVLYAISLRPNDDGWFCAAVPDLAVGFWDVPVTNQPDFRAGRTIYKFLMDNPRCAGNYLNDSIEYGNLLTGQWNLWDDTARKGELFDSTIPTMHDLGLDTLLKMAASVHYSTLGPPIILNARITQNPFDNATGVWLSIGREAYIRIEVLDVLGRDVAGAGYAGTFEHGTREVPLDLSNAPPGNYYVRISTANNEVRTLKITKE